MNIEQSKIELLKKAIATGFNTNSESFQISNIESLPVVDFLDVRCNGTETTVYESDDIDVSTVQFPLQANISTPTTSSDGYTFRNWHEFVSTLEIRIEDAEDQKDESRYVDIEIILNEEDQSGN